jgi:hypothetical protein
VRNWRARVAWPWTTPATSSLRIITIREIMSDGIITTLAGNGNGASSGDGGPATSAQLLGLQGVTVDAAGNIFIADLGNNRVRKILPDGIIRTIAGDGTQGYSGDGGPATRASLSSPTALALDSAGDVYIADSGNSAIRILRPDSGPSHRRRNRP